MKPINKTLALLFAAVAFTACTNQFIEPIRPITQVQPTVRLDTANNPQPVTVKDEQPVRPQRGKVLTIEEPVLNDHQPVTVNEPLPSQPLPRLTVQPVIQADTVSISY